MGSLETGPSFYQTVFDDVRVTRGNAVLFEEDFTSRDPSMWDLLQSFLEVDGGVGIFGRPSTALVQGSLVIVFALSLAPGPDGRIYVLDAGNSRIQVFDADGVYVTQ